MLLDNDRDVFCGAARKLGALSVGFIDAQRRVAIAIRLTFWSSKPLELRSKPETMESPPTGYL
jgi:hypothetical protein